MLRSIGMDIKDLATLTVLGMTVIQVTPIRINPWSWLLSRLGRAVNHEIYDMFGDMKTDMEGIKRHQRHLEETLDERDAISSRVRIVRFGDEISHGLEHSQESFFQVLDDIDHYEDYCSSHPGFINNRTVMTTRLIKETYKKRLEKGDFI